MKNTFCIKLLVATTFLFFSICGNTQTINWNNTDRNHRNIINFNFGADYGMVLGMGYNYLLSPGKFPILLSGDFSTPAGENMLDDFKTKIGGQISSPDWHHMRMTLRAQGVFRRTNNTSVTLMNFGSDLAGTVGYYRTHWFVAAETGFDKAIVTHFKHSQFYKDNIYGNVENGWFEPSTGGNFYYGLQAGYSFGRNDIVIRAGKIKEQYFEGEPLIPAYGTLSYNFRF